GGGDGADRECGNDQYGVAGDRPVEPDLGLVEDEEVLAKFEIFFYRPPEPGGADQPGHAHALAFRGETVVKGQLAAGKVAADQQVMPRRGGSQQRPPTPALALGAGPSGADLPAARAGQQAGSRLRARHGDPAGPGEAGGGGDPQHTAPARPLEARPPVRGSAL